MATFRMIVACLAASIPAAVALADPSSFVTVSGNHFQRDGKDYTFVGANLWYGMNLGSEGPGGDPGRLDRELDRLQKLGVTNLRILGLSQGPDTASKQIVPALEKSPGVYEQDQLKGLDFLLSEMKKRKMTATVVLGDYWEWSGGMDQYRKWSANQSKDSAPDPAKGTLTNLVKMYEDHVHMKWGASGFYSDQKAMDLNTNAIRMLLTRTNSITGQPYSKDSTIMSWELANEPRGANNKDDFNKWIDQTSGMIKSLDPNHLITTGSEGQDSSKWTGNELLKNHGSKNIDYATVHIWAQNAGWYNPDKAEKTYPNAVAKMHEKLEQNVQLATQLGKPIVLEEFGLARDQSSLDPASSVQYRDKYYQDVFEQVYQLAKKGTPVSGVDFWAWGGEAQPKTPLGQPWKPGDPFTGDPPHEPQGWYSVYATDTSTEKIISDYARKIPQARLEGSNPAYASLVEKQRRDGRLTDSDEAKLKVYEAGGDSTYAMLEALTAKDVKLTKSQSAELRIYRAGGDFNYARIAGLKADHEKLTPADEAQLKVYTVGGSTHLAVLAYRQAQKETLTPDEQKELSAFLASKARLVSGAGSSGISSSSGAQ